MIRSSNSVFAERVNQALELLGEIPSNGKVAAVLMEKYGVSRRQAYRYIKEAQKTKSKLPVPEPKEVFTVKLPVSLIFRVRRLAKSTGESLSHIVTQALKAFIKRREHVKEDSSKASTDALQL